MSIRDTRWLRLRRRLGPVTRRVPYGHLVTESATYTRLLLPGLKRPDRRFVIFAQGRSGSTLLADLLNSHPGVYCADEILTWQRRDPARYALACSVGHKADTYGFKVKIYQLTEAQQIASPNAWLRDMHAQGWAVLQLRRRNVLRQALSSMVAEQRRVYHEEGQTSQPQPVLIDIDDLLQRTQRRVTTQHEEDQALQGVPHESFVYEDDLLRPETHQATADRAFGFLGLASVPVTTGLRKIADRPLEQVVTNAQAVRAAVASSPYAPLLVAD